MRSTGIIRRIDDLGRVVIPKEVRCSMKIREGDPLEIYVDKDCGMVCFQKVDMKSDVCTELKLIQKKYSDFLSVSEEMMINHCIEEIGRRNNKDCNSDE